MKTYREYVRNIKVLQPFNINGKRLHVGDVVNPRNHGIDHGLERTGLLRHMERRGLIEIRTNKKAIL